MKVPVEGFAGRRPRGCWAAAGQEELLEKVIALGKPTVLVLLNGSAWR